MVATKAKRVTAASVIFPLLVKGTKMSAEKLIGLVRAKSGSKKFDASQLAWYRSQVKAGHVPAKYSAN